MATDDLTENTFWGPEVVKKHCSKCKERKPLGHFSLKWYREKGKKYHNSWCRACLGKKKSTWDRDHPQEASRRSRYFQLRQYGMTPADYEERLARQGGLCAICRKPE